MPWWDGKRDEIYWCEITDRDNIGDDLLCPQLDEGGRPYWSYSLIKQIRPGDIVFHYSTRERAFTGASVAKSHWVPDSFIWAPHGTVGRANRRRRQVRAAWRLPLGNFVAVSPPLTLDSLQRDQRWIREWIATKKKQGSVMAPFQPYPNLLRATQGYLTKMPGDFVRRWEPLARVAASLGSPFLQDRESTMVGIAEEQDARERGQGFLANAVVRRAIERHAVEMAKEHYGKRWSHIEEKGKPFDLLCTNSIKRLHVEVKGTSTGGDVVWLTRNEVSFARKHQNAMALFIAKNLKVSGTADDPRVSGGEVVILEPWDVDEGLLEPLAYSYQPPSRAPDSN